MADAVAVITAFVLTDGCVVLTVNVPMVEPGWRGNGAVATGATGVLPLDNDTTILPGPAGASSTTVPVTALPPTTGFGVKLIDDTPIPRTVSVAVLLTPLDAAVMVT